MNNRIKLLRKHLNLSQEAFGKKLGVTGAGISKIESGHRNLTEQMILLICKEFSINENWLRHGEGDIFLQKPSTGLEQLANYYELDDLDLRIIQEYIKLDGKKRKVIKEYIMKLADSSRSADSLSYATHQSDELRCAEGSDVYE